MTDPQPLHAEPALVEPEALLGDYRIVGRIGAGSYGQVFEAEHVITGRHDAVKILSGSHHLEDEEQRFLREIQVQASLQHPNIATVYTAFRTPHGLALVMELVPGEPLSALLERGRVPIQRGISLGLGMLAGLGQASAFPAAIERSSYLRFCARGSCAGPPSRRS